MTRRTLRVILSCLLPLGLVAAGGLIRIFFSATVGMTCEDSLKLALTQSISFHPDHPYLLYWGQGLPLVGLYLLKGFHTLFGNRLLALRLPWILAGTFTLWMVYRLAERGLGRPQALLALFLLAVDQFHVTWTRIFYADVLMIACEVLALWCFWRADRGGQPVVEWIRAG